MQEGKRKAARGKSPARTRPELESAADSALGARSGWKEEGGDRKAGRGRVILGRGRGAGARRETEATAA